MVTEVGEKKKSPIVTLADADFSAFALPPPGGLVAGDLSPITGEAVPDWSCGSVGVPAPGPPDAVGPVETDPPGSTGGAGSAGVVVVAGVVPASCAADTAGTAQIAARTSIPLARALAPFTLSILRPLTRSQLRSFGVSGLN